MATLNAMSVYSFLIIATLRLLETPENIPKRQELHRPNPKLCTLFLKGAYSKLHDIMEQFLRRVYTPEHLLKDILFHILL